MARQKQRTDNMDKTDERGVFVLIDQSNISAFICRFRAIRLPIYE